MCIPSRELKYPLVPAGTFESMFLFPKWDMWSFHGGYTYIYIYIFFNGLQRQPMGQFIWMPDIFWSLISWFILWGHFMIVWDSWTYQVLPGKLTISPQNQWLEDVFQNWINPFLWDMLVFGGVVQFLLEASWISWLQFFGSSGSLKGWTKIVVPWK